MNDRNNDLNNDLNMEPVDDRDAFDGEPSGERLTTADMVAAASVPARAKEIRDVNPPSTRDTSASEEGFAPLFDQGELEEFRSRWYSVQAGFVDEPQRSVEEADELVASVMKRLAEIFAGERENLERGWGTGDDISTEDLRIALRRYRSFFDRLLSV